MLKKRIIKYIGKVFFVLPMFLFLYNSYCHAQQQFEFVYPKEFGDEEVLLSFYFNGTIKKLRTKKSKLVIPKNFIVDADSIVASFSFYNKPLQRNAFNSNIIYLDEGSDLDEVVVRPKKYLYVGASNKNYVPYIIAKGELALLDLPTKRLTENLRLVGIRYKFRKGNKLIHGYSSLGKKFKVKLLGYHRDKHGKETSNLLEDELVYTIPDKISKWFEIDLSDQKINHEEFNFLIFGLEALDNGILLHQYQRSEKELSNKTISHHGILHRFSGIPLEERKWLGYDTIPVIQLIFEDLNK